MKDLTKPIPALQRLERIRTAMYELWRQGQIECCLRNIPLLVEKLEEMGPEHAREARALSCLAKCSCRQSGSRQWNSPPVIGFDGPFGYIEFDLAGFPPGAGRPSNITPAGYGLVNSAPLFWLPPGQICLHARRMVIAVHDSSWDHCPTMDLLPFLDPPGPAL